MIQITIYRKAADQTLKGMRVSGHAGAGEYGKDIVCAGVSALVTNLVNSIEAYTSDEILLITDEQAGLIQFKFKDKPGHDSILLMDSCILGLESICKENREYAVLRIREV